jgi:acetyltransferase-like isoleucine patch superfamily enzyme
MSQEHRNTQPDAATESGVDQPAITPQQRRFRSDGVSALQTYRNLMVADKGWLSLLGYELYMLAFSSLPGILGFGGRTLTLPLFLDGMGKGSMVGRNVLIRQPSRVSIGRKVIIDDYAVIDVRDTAEQPQPPHISIGDYSFIGRQSAIISKGATIELGSGTNISSFCRIASASSITLGESILIASYVYIGPGNHSRDESGRVEVEAEMESRGGVRIGSGSWIGTRATILDGVTIGENAIVGAHSLVRDDVPAGAVVAGVPAKILSKK